MSQTLTPKQKRLINPSELWSRNIDEYTISLEKLHETLAKVFLKLNRLQINMEDLPDKMRQIQARLEQGVVDLQVQGKPAYSNEMSRKSAIELALKEDKEYLKYSRKFKHARKEELNLICEEKLIKSTILKYSALLEKNQSLLRGRYPEKW